MPNVILTSDLHLEFCRGSSHQIVSEELIKNNSSDSILILAGDVCELKEHFRIVDFFGDVCSYFKHVIWVPGNHEFYGTSIRDGLKFFKNFSRLYTNLHALNNEEVTLDGQHFVGSTLWFPDTNNPEDITLFYRAMLDGAEIQCQSPRIVYQDIVEEHAKAVDFLRKSVRSDSIVITHHMPTYQCIAPKWRGYASNLFFVGDVGNLSLTPKIWCFGHTHESMDFSEANTRYVSNPFGYLGNNRRFLSKKVIYVTD